jgi:hypothetical protein
MEKQAVEGYIQAGGKINQCPPCDTLYRKPQKQKIWHAPQNGHDKEICKDCENKGRCEKPCIPLEWIDGNVERKEIFINERMLQYEHPDYKTIIYDLSNHKTPPNRLEEIIEIQNTTHRAICALMMARIPKKKIAMILNMSRTQLYRIIRTMLHSKTCTSPTESND